MDRRLFAIVFLGALLMPQTNSQVSLPQNLLQILRQLQVISGGQFQTGDTLQVISQPTSRFSNGQQPFQRQDIIIFQQQPQFRRSQPQPQLQFQPQSQPQFQPQPQPQFQPQPQPQFQPQPQPQFQPQFQPQPQSDFQQRQPTFQPQPPPQPEPKRQPIVTTQRPTPQPLLQDPTPLNISENVIQSDSELRQQSTKDPQFLAPGSGRWLLERDPACLPCICETASGCDETLQCDSRGFCGPFLLSKRYWTLAGKPLLKGDTADRAGASEDCLRDPLCAAEAVRGYLDKFAQDCDGNRKVDCLDLARVHFQGPFNCRAAPFEYMGTFRRCWDASKRSLTA